MTRDHDVSLLTTAELERARRELAASMAIARPSSPSAGPAQAQMRAIDAELVERVIRPEARPRHR